MQHWLRNWQPYFAPPNDGNGGGGSSDDGDGDGSGDGESGTSGNGQGSDMTPEDVVNAVEEAVDGVIPDEVLDSLQNHAEETEGGWQAFALTLANENKNLRDKLRNVSEAPEGAAVIDPDKTDAYAKIKEYGDLEQVVNILEEANELKRETTLRRAQVDPDVWDQLAGTGDLGYRIETRNVETDDGTEERDVPCVLHEGDDGEITSTPVRQYAEENYSAFTDRLFQDGNGEQGSGGNSQSGSGPRQPRRPGPSGDSGEGSGGGEETEPVAARSEMQKYQWGTRGD